MCGYTRKRGFTLIEVLCVMGLFAVVSGLALAFSPNLLQAFQTPSTEQFIKDTVETARRSARSTRHEVQLRYDKVAQTFILHTQKETTGNPLNSTLKFTDVVFHLLLPVEFDGNSVSEKKYGEPSPSILFSPDGSSQPFAMDVYDASNFVRYEFNPITGIVKPKK